MAILSEHIHELIRAELSCDFAKAKALRDAAPQPTAKAGRVLSARNTALVTAALDALRELIAAAEAEGDSETAAKATELYGDVAVRAGLPLPALALGGDRPATLWLDAALGPSLATRAVKSVSDQLRRESPTGAGTADTPVSAPALTRARTASSVFSGLFRR